MENNSFECFLKTMNSILNSCNFIINKMIYIKDFYECVDYFMNYIKNEEDSCFVDAFLSKNCTYGNSRTVLEYEDINLIYNAGRVVRDVVFFRGLPIKYIKNDDDYLYNISNFIKDVYLNKSSSKLEKYSFLLKFENVHPLFILANLIDCKQDYELFLEKLMDIKK